MTTICFDGKAMAGDRRITFGQTVVNGATKIARAPDGRLIGAAGNAPGCEAMLAYLMLPEDARGDLPTFQCDDNSSVTVLEALPGGRLIVWQTGGPFEVDAPFAYGSGADFALAAMACGKSASGAVAIAAMFDSGTGGKIDVLKLK